VAIAVDMGAIDFIKHGSPEAIAKCRLGLVPLDAPGSVQEPLAIYVEEDPQAVVKEIEKFSGTLVMSSRVGYSSLIQTNKQ
jgi:hypothetical protein